MKMEASRDFRGAPSNCLRKQRLNRGETNENGLPKKLGHAYEWSELRNGNKTHGGGYDHAVRPHRQLPA
jgi:hypothetical protein